MCLLFERDRFTFGMPRQRCVVTADVAQKNWDAKGFSSRWIWSGLSGIQLKPETAQRQLLSSSFSEDSDGSSNRCFAVASVSLPRSFSPKVFGGTSRFFSARRLPVLHSQLPFRPKNVHFTGSLATVGRKRPN
jgi:hypothetical protein